MADIKVMGRCQEVNEFKRLGLHESYINVETFVFLWKMYYVLIVSLLYQTTVYYLVSGCKEVRA